MHLASVPSLCLESPSSREAASATHYRSKLLKTHVPSILCTGRTGPGQALQTWDQSPGMYTGRDRAGAILAPDNGRDGSIQLGGALLAAAPMATTPHAPQWWYMLQAAYLCPLVVAVASARAPFLRVF